MVCYDEILHTYTFYHCLDTYWLKLCRTLSASLLQAFLQLETRVSLEKVIHLIKQDQQAKSLF